MPIIRSAIKRAKQNPVRHARLLPFKTQMKTMIRTFTRLMAEGKTEEAKKALPAVFKAIDTAAKKHIIHRKNAAHKKSGVSRLLAKVSKK
ncbi:MAG: 30S ribosomal protein S20 [Candidatus Peregrinibacteria bacterium]